MIISLEISEQKVWENINFLWEKFVIDISSIFSILTPKCREAKMKIGYNLDFA